MTFKVDGKDFSKIYYVDELNEIWLSSSLYSTVDAARIKINCNNSNYNIYYNFTAFSDPSNCINLFF